MEIRTPRRSGGNGCRASWLWIIRTFEGIEYPSAFAGRQAAIEYLQDGLCA